MVASQNVLRTDSVCVNKSEGGDTGDWYILITKKHTHTHTETGRWANIVEQRIISLQYNLYEN